MANRDDLDEEGGNETLDADIFRHTQQIYKHLLVILLVGFLSLGGFGAGIYSLASIIKITDKLLAIEPENRANKLGKEIAKVSKQVENQYADYKSRMDDESIYDINKKFEVMYQLSKESEQAYTQVLSSYQEASYQAASKIRGSGEWYYYYERDLKKYARRQSDREKKLLAYLSNR